MVNFGSTGSSSIDREIIEKFENDQARKNLEAANKKLEENLKLRRESIVHNRAVSKLKAKLFEEMPVFSENGLNMKSEISTFTDLMFKEGDCNLAWKYNRIVNWNLIFGKEYLNNDIRVRNLLEGTKNYLVVRFW